MRISSRALSLCFMRAMSVILRYLLFLLLPFVLRFVMLLCCDFPSTKFFPCCFPFAAFPCCLRGLACMHCVRHSPCSLLISLSASSKEILEILAQAEAANMRHTLIALQNYPDCLHSVAIFRLARRFIKS